jgi:hypothetical protein
MTKTKINGKWVYDAQKDYSNKPAQTTKTTAPVATKIVAQRDAMAEALKSIAQCKNISQVRKCLEHARQVYPK